jgi:hypothetical protein
MPERIAVSLVLGFIAGVGMAYPAQTLLHVSEDKASWWGLLAGVLFAIAAFVLATCLAHQDLTDQAVAAGSTPLKRRVSVEEIDISEQDSPRRHG